MKLTDAQRNALKWLAARGGDGMFDNDGVLIAAGERAPFMRSTWNVLRDNGHVVQYEIAGRPRSRICIKPVAMKAAEEWIRREGEFVGVEELEERS